MISLYAKLLYLYNCYFYPHPRASRGEYFTNMLLDWCMIAILTFISSAVEQLTHTISADTLVETVRFLNVLILTISLSVLLIRSYFTSLRRLHDIGHSGFSILLLFLPLINIVIVFMLFFSPGDRGMNDYGNNPLGNKV